nr:MAG TPA: hypothetical protein [Caudoviricetes sp.]
MPCLLSTLNSPCSSPRLTHHEHIYQRIRCLLLFFFLPHMELKSCFFS